MRVAGRPHDPRDGRPPQDGWRLAREINEKIREPEVTLDGEHDFCCECDDETCTGVLRLTAAEYAFVRAGPRLVVVPGHERSTDEVISRTDRFIVISEQAGEQPQPEVVADRPNAPCGRYTGLRLYRRLLREARPYWRHIGALLGLSLLSSVFALLTPLPLAIVVDSVVGSQPLPGFVAVIVPPGVGDSQTGVLLVAAGLVVLLAVLKQLQQFGNLVLTTYTGEKLLLDFRSRLFRHAERLSLAYHDTRGTADSTYRVQYDATAVQTIAVSGLIPLISASVTVAGMVYVTARIDVQLALVSLTVAPVLFFAMRFYRKRLRARWHDAKRLESSALSVVQESLDALRVVKAFGREEDAGDRFADRSAASVRAKIGLARLEGRFGMVVGATVGLGMGTVLFVGTSQVLAGTMTLGELVLVMGYLQQLYDPLKTASRKVGSLQSSLASAERVYSVLDEAPDFVDPPDAQALTRASGAVAFRGVSFAYESGHRVLHDVSFEIAPGTRLGIAGATGAGKTTLVSLLTRFYDPSSGAIVLDGVDLRRYRLADLRSQFAIVLQDPVLFSTSIGENIAYARPDADFVDVVAAAKAAGAHDFICALPDGYATAVGERGVRLSGGERQRIALARAFLKDAPILILDEPTSAIDAQTEAQILDATKRLMVGRTVLMIAHRPNTLEICEARLELEHGRVVRMTPPETAGALRPAAQVSVARRPPRRRVPVRCDPVTHPVVAAWRTIAPARTRVGRVDCLRAKRKAQIYRLALEDGTTSVIAKRARSDTLRVERTVYESVLPRLPAPALRCFGFVVDDDEEFAWLFIEDAGDDRCSIAEHGGLAARWLGTLHGASAELDSTPSLPERGPAQYLEHLRAGFATILDCFDNCALSADDQGVLGELILDYELIESSWNAVEAICAELPRTLVHGDFVARNLGLRRDETGLAMVAFDWEWSGWGVPAADFHILARDATGEDLLSYCSAMSNYTRALDEDQMRLLAFVGTGFRLLASVDWVTPHLRYAWPWVAMRKLRVYEEPLRAWAAVLGAAA